MREEYIPPRAVAIDMVSKGTVLTGSETEGVNEGWIYEDL